MDFETIKKMKVNELKDFLKLHGLRISGNKEQLLSRFFCDVENNVQPVKTAEEVEGQLSKEYKDKLWHMGIEIPDPFKLENGWKTESEGTKEWSSVSSLYIVFDNG